MTDIVIREAQEADARQLARLAALDEGRVPAGRALVAEVDGTFAAALGLDDGAVLADPFRRTAETVALLRLRANQLRPPDAGGGRGGGLQMPHWTALLPRRGLV